MVFGKINYLNLLPFHVFLKRQLQSSSQKTALSYRKGVPAEINKKLAQRRIDAAVISSVKSFGYDCTDMGIVADGAVWSVFVLQDTQPKSDDESNTSNVLAEILGLHGEVMIGDKALVRFLSGAKVTDLGEAWHEATGLPFVFARLCYCRHGRRYQKLAKRFLATRVRIPQYILKRRAEAAGVAPKDVLRYLDRISYRIGAKEKRALRRFHDEAKRRGLL